MKRTLITLLLIIGLLVGCDWLVGIVGNRLLRSLPPAGTPEADCRQALMEAAPQVLLLGSSRTKHEYVPRIIADSLHMSVYNAGMDGNGMNYSMVVLESVLERTTPRLVVLDVLDAMMNDQWVTCVDQWDCYYGVNAPATCYIDTHATWQKRLKMHSNLYRLNGVSTWMAKAYALGANEHLDGYTPLVGTMPGIKHKRYRGFDVDSTELACLDHIVALCRDKGIALRVFMSPNYEHNLDFNAWLAQYCRAHDVAFADFTTAFDGHTELFVEPSHLNEQGAERYTRLIAGLLLQ